MALEATKRCRSSCPRQIRVASVPRLTRCPSPIICLREQHPETPSREGGTSFSRGSAPAPRSSASARVPGTRRNRSLQAPRQRLLLRRIIHIPAARRSSPSSPPPLPRIPAAQPSGPLAPPRNAARAGGPPNHVTPRRDVTGTAASPHSANSIRRFASNFWSLAKMATAMAVVVVARRPSRARIARWLREYATHVRVWSNARSGL